MPAIYRRKPGNLGKIALTAMNDVYEGGDVKLVFASNYGDFERTLKLIDQKNTEGEVSPNSFSFSVHNSSVGLFSLINKINSPYNSISAGENTFSAGLTESIITAGNVLYCFAQQVGGLKSLALFMGSKPRKSAIKIELTDVQKNLDDFLKLLGEYEKNL